MCFAVGGFDAGFIVFGPLRSLLLVACIAVTFHDTASPAAAAEAGAGAGAGAGTGAGAVAGAGTPAASPKRHRGVEYTVPDVDARLDRTPWLPDFPESQWRCEYDEREHYGGLFVNLNVPSSASTAAFPAAQPLATPDVI